MTTSERDMALIKDLVALPSETEWVEFKGSNYNPKIVGDRISALANAARLADKDIAYMIWGVEDETHSIKGTSFNPKSEKIGNQPYEFSIVSKLKPRIQLTFKDIEIEGKRIVLLEIPAATHSPVEYNNVARIRVGSASPKLSDHPEYQRNLWSRLQSFNWETVSAKKFVTSDDVLRLLNYPAYFELMRRPLPDNREGILENLNQDQIIGKDVGGRWNITNSGAILFAKNLKDFGTSTERKALRVIQYEGASRASRVLNRFDLSSGYAVGFEEAARYVNSLLPNNEFIGEALRQEVELFPKIAIRELLANALIHQDLTISGTGPNLEIFENRMEISNPGKPLNPTDRFIDYPPKSRNEHIATLMRRMAICEEQGSGVDKVVSSVELYQLPPPDFRAEGDTTKVILFGPRTFAKMTPKERVRACYQHAVLKYLNDDKMKNASLCQRLGVESKNASQISKVIKLSLQEKVIKVSDPDHPKAGYIPFWA